MNRVLHIGLWALILFLQFKLWISPQGLPGLYALRKELRATEARYADLQARHSQVAQDVAQLKKNPHLLEEIARQDLGMIREDEVYYQWAEDQEPPTS